MGMFQWLYLHPLTWRTNADHGELEVVMATVDLSILAELPIMEE
jgi:hypothetical protein